MNSLLQCFLFAFVSTSCLKAAVVQDPSVSGLNNQMGGDMYIDPITGYDFTPTRPFPVDYLGVYDDASNGLTRPHTVGLFIRQTGEMIASATVDNIGILEGVIRWERIPRVMLVPGVVYNISSYNQAEDRIHADWAYNLQMHPDITNIQGYIEDDQRSFHMPTSRGGPGAVFLGPAFGTAVPEPSIVSLLCVGAGAAFTAWRRRKTASQCTETGHFDS